MKKKILILTAIGALCIGMPRTYGNDTQTAVVTIVDGDETEKFEVVVKSGYVYITTSKPVTIQLYSILGQLVAQQAIPAGTTRIKAPGRGVFILKAGAVTRRVTVNS